MADPIRRSHGQDGDTEDERHSAAFMKHQSECTSPSPFPTFIVMMRRSYLAPSSDTSEMPSQTSIDLARFLRKLWLGRLKGIVDLQRQV